jgi:polyisoprenoid-binding protein YceI
MAIVPDIALPRPCRRVLCGIALCASALVVHAGEAETYAFDPVHTRVLFAVEHAGFSKALGTVSGSTGKLLFDRDDWRSAKLEVGVPLTRLDLGDAKWNAAALARNLLDGERHPEARFVSSAVEPVDPEHARVCGELTLRGVTRPLCLDVTLNALKRHPLPPFRRTAGFSATATLSRKEFGIDAWPTVIGDAVELRIEAEAVRARAGDEKEPGPAEPPVGEPPPAEPIPPELASSSLPDPPPVPPDPTP